MSYVETMITFRKQSISLNDSLGTVLSYTLKYLMRDIVMFTVACTIIQLVGNYKTQLTVVFYVVFCKLQSSDSTWDVSA
jgi:hypothetical protein